MLGKRLSRTTVSLPHSWELAFFKWSSGVESLGPGWNLGFPTCQLGDPGEVTCPLWASALRLCVTAVMRRAFGNCCEEENGSVPNTVPAGLCPAPETPLLEGQGHMPCTEVTEAMEVGQRATCSGQWDSCWGEGIQESWALEKQGCWQRRGGRRPRERAQAWGEGLSAQASVTKRQAGGLVNSRHSLLPVLEVEV